MSEQDNIEAARWTKLYDVLNNLGPDTTLTLAQLEHIVQRLWANDQAARDLPDDDASYLGFDLEDVFPEPLGKEEGAPKKDWPIDEVIHRVTSVIMDRTGGDATVEIFGEDEPVDS